MTDIRPHENALREGRVMERLQHLSLMICGCGALGGHYALAMARMGVSQFTLLDRDIVDWENMGSQPYGESDVGNPKVDALGELLSEANPDGVWLKTFHSDVFKTAKPPWELIPHSADLVIDAFDNRAARAWVTDVTEDLELPCLHLGMNGDFGSVVWDARYQVPVDLPELPDNCAHPFSLSLVYRITSAAIEATCEFVDDYEDKVDYRVRGMEITRYG